MKNKIKWLIAILGIGVFSFLFILVLKDKTFKIDTTIYHFIAQFFSDKLTFVVKVISNLAGPLVLIMLAISSIFIFAKKKYSYCICLNLALCTLLNIVVKNIAMRPRPSFPHLVVETGYSFPSGHAMAAMAFYGFIIYLIYKMVQNKIGKRIAISFFSILIILISASRIYL